MSNLDNREVAEWLNNADGNGASDEDFVETMVFMYLINKGTKKPDENLTESDMRSFDTKEFTKWLKDVMDEILFSDEIDSSAWWKQNDQEKDIYWNGRAYVDEESITPEQYKMIFDRDMFGISYKSANRILENMKEGVSEEVIPCDELSEEARSMISEQILKKQKKSGKITIEGQTIHWRWELEILIDGKKAKFKELNPDSREKIVNDMLEDKRACGSFYQF